ncbi:uncharacterized protein si:ch211-130h14.4 [Osmerus eperlanus]|uniref:uncharacterized protein si:ch211-130h14.4 n=1 Tax=Osmerus eperlanus TaxID=29151 RepID=UPI002E0F029D
MACRMRDVHQDSSLPSILESYRSHVDAGQAKERKLQSRKERGQNTADGRKGRDQNIEDPLKSDLDPEAPARRQALTDQRHLQGYRSLRRLRDGLYRRYGDLLREKIASQRRELRQHSLAACLQTEDTPQQKQRLPFSPLRHDESFLTSLPKSRYYLSLQRGPAQPQRNQQDTRSNMMGSSPAPPPAPPPHRDQKTPEAQQDPTEQMASRVKIPKFSSLQPSFLKNLQSSMPETLLQPPQQSRRAQLYNIKLHRMHTLSLTNMAVSQRYTLSLTNMAVSQRYILSLTNMAVSQRYTLSLTNMAVSQRYTLSLTNMAVSQRYTLSLTNMAVSQRYILSLTNMAVSQRYTLSLTNMAVSQRYTLSLTNMAVSQRYTLSLTNMAVSQRYTLSLTNMAVSQRYTLSLTNMAVSQRYTLSLTNMAVSQKARSTSCSAGVACIRLHPPAARLT